MNVIGYIILFLMFWFFLLFWQKYLQRLITNSVLQTSKMRSSWDNRISKNQQTDPAWADSSSCFLFLYLFICLPFFISVSLSFHVFCLFLYLSYFISVPLYKSPLSFSLTVQLYICTFVWVAYVCFLICLTLYLYLYMSRLCLFLYLSNFMLVSLSLYELPLSVSLSV